MNEARVRLFFHDSLPNRERMAAHAGAAAFRDFGVVFDWANAKQKDAFRNVRAGDQLRMIANSGYPVVKAENLLREAEWRAEERSVFGLVVTPRPLVKKLMRAGGNASSLAVSVLGIGSVLSTYRFSNDATLEGNLFERAIAALVRYELGHVFGVKDHCVDTDCIMQANGGYADFIDNIVKPAREFCAKCEGKIRAVIAQIAQTY
jgi:predicted Zn-dependent protease